MKFEQHVHALQLFHIDSLHQILGRLFLQDFHMVVGYELVSISTLIAVVLQSLQGCTAPAESPRLHGSQRHGI